VGSSIGRELSLFVVAMLGGGFCAGCSVGVGEGYADGFLTDPECGLAEDAYSLGPTFFGGEVLDVGDQFAIQVQRGGNLEGTSDGLRILVAGAADVSNGMLGLPFDLAAADPAVRMSLYLNETCPIGFEHEPTRLSAVGGTIVFDSIYAPMVDDQALETSARFSAVRFVDPSRPEERHAELDGSFRFNFNRGRPAQRYP
jgi:hypothetical protein